MIIPKGANNVAAAPFMPFYVSEYLADAGHLSTLEHGAYMLLIMAYWQRGDALPDDDKRLANLARMSVTEWSAVRPEIEEFFDLGDGKWAHGRIEHELSKAVTKVEAARNAGRASAQRRLNGRSTRVQRTLNERSTSKRREEKREPNGSLTPNPFAGKTWDAWIAQRKTKPTDQAIALMIIRLEALQADGHAPDDVMNQSMMNGWTGLFAVKGDFNDKRLRGGGSNGADKRSGLARALDGAIEQAEGGPLSQGPALLGSDAPAEELG